jgi:two-component system cell cycle response regulator DivK
MRKVLVCDDDQDVLYMVTFILSESGWQVDAIKDYNNIIERVTEFTPSVILMDINFPKINAATFTESLKENPNLNAPKVEQNFKQYFEPMGVKTTQLLKSQPQTLHIPVILFSAREDIATLAEEAGTILYLKKPFAAKKLEEIVNKAYLNSKRN